MYNRERQLRSSVVDLLDLAPAMRRPLAIVVVDDGSTDETYETACELARQYPRLTVLRQPFRQGFGAALDLVRNQLGPELVVVHDGVSAIDAAQLQALMHADTTTARDAQPRSTAHESSGSRRFAGLRTLHNRMEVAHRLATSFRWMQLEKPLVPRRRSTASRPTDSACPSIGLPIEIGNVPLGIVPTPRG